MTDELAMLRRTSLELAGEVEALRRRVAELTDAARAAEQLMYEKLLAPFDSPIAAERAAVLHQLRVALRLPERAVLDDRTPEKVWTTGGVEVLDYPGPEEFRAAPSTGETTEAWIQCVGHSSRLSGPEWDAEHARLCTRCECGDARCDGTGQLIPGASPFPTVRHVPRKRDRAIPSEETPQPRPWVPDDQQAWSYDERGESV